MSNKELIDKLLKASEIIHKLMNSLYNERVNSRKEKIIRIFNEED